MLSDVVSEKGVGMDDSLDGLQKRIAALESWRQDEDWKSHAWQGHGWNSRSSWQ